MIIMVGVLVAMAIGWCGCETVQGVTRTELDVRKDAQGNVSAALLNPKDTSFDRLLVDPGTGLVTIENYKSAANIAAVQEAGAAAKAQAEERQFLYGLMLQMVREYRPPAPLVLPEGFPLLAPDAVVVPTGPPVPEGR